MAFYLSPLVAVNEYDATTTIPAVATSIAVIILRDTYKGPEMKTQFISSVDDLVTVFGKPTSAAPCYKDMLAATGYLKYGSMLYATRALAASAAFANVQVTIPSATSIAASASSESAMTLADMETYTRDVGGDVDDFSSQATAVDSAISDFMWFVANSRGEWGNKIRIAFAGKNFYESCSALVDARSNAIINTTDTWSTSAAIGKIDSPIEDEHSFLVVVQTVEQGLIPSITATTSGTESLDPTAGGSSNWITTEYFNVSLNPDAYDDTGRKRFVETLINETSGYVKCALGSGYTIATDMSNVKTNNWIYLTSGVDGNIMLDTAGDTAIMNALDLYQNPEEIDVNIFIDADKSVTVKQYIDTICQARKDAMGILDCEMADVVANRTQETEDLRDFVSNFNDATCLGINSSYSCIYGNWREIYDKWNGKYRWIPMSGHAAGLFANNDYVSEPWFAPAGPNRAVVTGVRRLAWNPNLAQRNILYKNGINPVVSLSGMGKLKYGKKTLLLKDSAFNRINIRRLFMVLEKAIATASRYFLFEPNDDITRLLLINMIDPFLRDVKARRGIYDYLLVCNETNNTPERIDRGELWCDIYIKPTRAAEFIVLNFIATKTGASFSELAGIAG